MLPPKLDADASRAAADIGATVNACIAAGVDARAIVAALVTMAKTLVHATRARDGRMPPWERWI